MGLHVRHGVEEIYSMLGQTLSDLEYIRKPRVGGGAVILASTCTRRSCVIPGFSALLCGGDTLWIIAVTKGFFLCGYNIWMIAYLTRI